jgi:CRP-like cAMP-binding protein
VEKELVQQLSRVSHFKSLPLKDITAIVSAGRVRRIPVGELVFREGAPSAGLFVLLSGLIHLVKVGPQGQEFIMAVIKPVIMFNEVAALDCEANPASARAAEGSLVWNVPCDRFQKLLESYPIVGLGLLKVMASRNRLLVNQYEDLSFRPVMGRLAKLFMELSQNGVKPINRREFPNTRLAAMVATVPEVMSRVMKTLNTEGFITMTREYIQIESPFDLTDLYEGLIDHKGKSTVGLDNP